MADSSPDSVLAPREPGFLTVLGDTLKRSAQLALLGAVAGAAITGAFMIGLGTDAVGNFFTETLKFGYSGSIPAVLTSGAMAGAFSGAMVGVPLGGVEGMHHVKQYYHDVALPHAHKLGEAQGVHLGATLEHQAMLHEAQSKQYRDTIARRAESHTGALEQDKQQGSKHAAIS